MTVPALERRCHLAHLPTPLWRSDALDRLVGAELWVKRDDMTAGAAAGNKIRKLEYLFADARARGADTVITCGGLQSNHARATALLARELGLDVVLYLRTTQREPSVLGNLLVDGLAGAEIRLISPRQYAKREALMADGARELTEQGRCPYVIPEGGSNALGALGYAAAMQEIRTQLDLGLGGGRPFDAVAHACGSGGTAAGCVLGAQKFGVAPEVHAFAVCDSSSYFDKLIDTIADEARALIGEDWPAARHVVFDEFKGPAYALSSPEQQAFLADATRSAGLLLDPVYSGKALFGLAKQASKPARVLFLHTGGLPGLLAQSERFAAQLGPFRDLRTAESWDR